MVISPITTTYSGLTKENNLVAEAIQKESEDSERRDPWFSFLRDAYGYRTKATEKPGQYQSIPTAHHALQHKDNQQRYIDWFATKSP